MSRSTDRAAARKDEGNFMLTSSNRALVFVLSSFLMAACASTPPPTDQLAVSRAAVDSAVRAGATDHAAVELALARGKLERAQAAMNSNNHLEARRLAEQAAVDAELAQARAASARARTAASQVDQSIRALREEIERTQMPAGGGAVSSGVPR
jgi:hypothetical protein